MELLSFGTVWNSVLVFGACAAALVTALLLMGCVIAETCVKPDAIARRQRRMLSALDNTGSTRRDFRAVKAA